jgi:hypothetical protein
MDNWSATSLNKDPLIEIHKKTNTNIIESIVNLPRNCCATSSCRMRRLLSIKHLFRGTSNRTPWKTRFHKSEGQL